ncbi:MAG: hemoglobin, partial [Spirosoma sp.]|nr:hemoglobin [Spirosoma sp.]
NVVAQVDWEYHIPRLVGFWSTILLGSDQYRANPVLPHLALGHKTSIYSAHFDQWLGLFMQTVDELFVGERAEQAKIRAQSIAVVLQSKLHGAGLLNHP